MLFDAGICKASLPSFGFEDGAGGPGVWSFRDLAGGGAKYEALDGETDRPEGTDGLRL